MLIEKLISKSNISKNFRKTCWCFFGGSITSGIGESANDKLSYSYRKDKLQYNIYTISKLPITKHTFSAKILTKATSNFKILIYQYFVYI